jgi:hypothetical protein
MRTTLTALGFAGFIGLVCCQSAGAVPAGTTAIKQAATAASAVQQAQYYERHTRHGIIKCYREAIFGKYTCHRYRYW